MRLKESKEITPCEIAKAILRLEEIRKKFGDKKKKELHFSRENLDGG
jgi:hypothetical protein